jgi:hypothetical protein
MLEKPFHGVNKGVGHQFTNAAAEEKEKSYINLDSEYTLILPSREQHMVSHKHACKG